MRRKNHLLQPTSRWGLSTLCWFLSMLSLLSSSLVERSSPHSSHSSSPSLSSPSLSSPSHLCSTLSFPIMMNALAHCLLHLPPPTTTPCSLAPLALFFCSLVFITSVLLLSALLLFFILLLSPFSHVTSLWRRTDNEGCGLNPCFHDSILRWNFKMKHIYCLLVRPDICFLE